MKFKFKLLKILLALVLTLSYSFFSMEANTASAGGVQMYQYSTSFNLQSGIWTACCWNDTSNAGGVKNPNGSYTYYGIMGTSAWLSSPQVYSQSISVTINTCGCSYYLGGHVELQGTTDGTNWTTLAYYSSGGTFTLTTGGNWNQIRMWQVESGWPPTNYSSYFSNGSISLNIYSSVADQATAQAALDAANAANQAAQATVSYAQNASTQASNASSYASQALNWLNGTWGGYNLGTVGTNATTAMNNSATTNSYLTNGTYGLNAINSNVTNIQSGVNSLNTKTDNLQNGVNNLQTSTSSIQTTANNIQSSVSNIQTSVNNITSIMPPTLNKVSGYNGATATSSTSFNVSLDYTNANEYSYMIDGGSWSTWTSLSSHDTLGYLTVTGISATGMHTIYVQIRNNVSGQISPIAKGKVTVFKL